MRSSVWWGLVLALSVVALLLLSSPLSPATIPLLLVALALAGWERVRIEGRTWLLARQIAAGELGEKLEVGGGAWGEISRAVNSMVQQSRRQRHLAALLPEIVEPAAQALIAGQVPLDGVTCQVAVLAIRPAGSDAHPDAALLPVWRILLDTVRTLARRESALMLLCGDTLLVIFGAYSIQAPTALLRAAVRVAAETHTLLDQALPDIVCAIATGTSTAAALPGVGYTVVGAPLAQALSLASSPASAPGTVLCAEASYLSLLQIGTPVPGLTLRVAST